MDVYKVVVLGDGGVGKTALTIQLCLNHFVESYDPTIEDSYRKQIIIDSRPCILEVLDTAGQDEYSALRDQWISDGDGFLLVYSVTSRQSFERIESFILQIARVKGPSNVAIVLAGNKSDDIAHREVEFSEGEGIARMIGCSFYETSAKRRVNVESAFSQVAKAIRSIQYPQNSNNNSNDNSGKFYGNNNNNSSNYNNNNLRMDTIQQPQPTINTKKPGKNKKYSKPARNYQESVDEINNAAVYNSNISPQQNAEHYSPYQNQNANHNHIKNMDYDDYNAETQDGTNNHSNSRVKRKNQGNSRHQYSCRCTIC